MAERTPRSKTMPGRGRTTRPTAKPSATPAASSPVESADLAALTALTAKVDRALDLLARLVTAQGKPAAVESKALTVRAFAREASLGTTKVYELLNNGKIASIKVGKRRLIPREELQRLLKVAQT